MQHIFEKKVAASFSVGAVHGFCNVDIFGIGFSFHKFFDERIRSYELWPKIFPARREFYRNVIYGNFGMLFSDFSIKMFKAIENLIWPQRRICCEIVFTTVNNDLLRSVGF